MDGRLRAVLGGTENAKSESLCGNGGKSYLSCSICYMR